MKTMSQPMFSGLYKLKIQEATGKDTKPDEGLVTNKLRMGDFEGLFDKVGTFVVGNETYYAVNDKHGDHFSQVDKLEEENLLAFARIGCWGPPDPKRAAEQERQLTILNNAFAAMVEKGQVGTITAEYEKKDIPGGPSWHPLDTIEIKRIDVQV
jgi:hypothetical protein